MKLMYNGRMLARARKKYGKPDYPGRKAYKSNIIEETGKVQKEMMQVKDVKDAEKIWRMIKAILKDEVSPVSYETWIDPCEAVQTVGNRIVLQVENGFMKEMLERRYLAYFRNAARLVTDGTITAVELITEK